MKKLSKCQEFIKLRGLGESFQSIGDKIGISKQTLIVWSRKFNTELAEAKLRVLDNVIEEYDLAKSGRLKIVAKELSRLDAELSKRDLASISTSKLLQLKLKALDVVGKILDMGKIEVGGTIAMSDPLLRWEDIVTRCGVVPDTGYEVKK